MNILDGHGDEPAIFAALPALFTASDSRIKQRYTTTMKVNGYGTIRPASTTRKGGSTSSASGFSDFLSAAETSENSGASSLSDVSGPSSLGSLLALQEVSEEQRKRQKTVKHGEDMLSSLEKLRQQLLIGAIPSDMLSELSIRLEEQRQGISDPNLMMLMEDIELRVAVELAKLEMAFASRAQL